MTPEMPHLVATTLRDVKGTEVAARGGRINSNQSSTDITRGDTTTHVSVVRILAAHLSVVEEELVRLDLVAILPELERP